MKNFGAYLLAVIAGAFIAITSFVPARDDRWISFGLGAVLILIGVASMAVHWARKDKP